MHECMESEILPKKDSNAARFCIQNNGLKLRKTG